jgi:hypothetical protein
MGVTGMRGSRGMRPVLSDWALLLRFDDGSVVELISGAGPAEMRAEPESMPVEPMRPHRTLRGRMGDTLHGMSLAARRLAAGEH